MISVIIATYNRALSLKKTIESLANQVLDDDATFEVIVSDNASTDETPKVVEELKVKYASIIDIKYLYDKKKGKCNALNNAISVARGEIVSFTDDDCIVDKRFILEVKRVFQQPEVDFVGGRIIFSYDLPTPRWF